MQRLVGLSKPKNPDSASATDPCRSCWIAPGLARRAGGVRRFDLDHAPSAGRTSVNRNAHVRQPGLPRAGADVDFDSTEWSEFTYLDGVALDAATTAPGDSDVIELPSGTWACQRTLPCCVTRHLRGRSVRVRQRFGNGDSVRRLRKRVGRSTSRHIGGRPGIPAAPPVPRCTLTP